MQDKYYSLQRLIVLLLLAVLLQSCSERESASLPVMSVKEYNERNLSNRRSAVQVIGYVNKNESNQFILNDPNERNTIILPDDDCLSILFGHKIRALFSPRRHMVENRMTNYFTLRRVSSSSGKIDSDMYCIGDRNIPTNG